MDALNGLPLAEIQVRGQWAVYSSVLRYAKHGRYMRLVARLPNQVRDGAAANIRELRHKLIPALRAARR